MQNKLQEQKLRTFIKNVLKESVEDENTGTKTAIKSNTFDLVFSVSATHIPMSEYDDVVQSALLDTFYGFRNQFRIQDYSEHVHETAHILKKDTIGGGGYVSMTIKIDQEYYPEYHDEEDNDLKTPEKLMEAIKNQLGNFEYIYHMDYDKSDIADISLNKITLIS